MGEMKDLKFFNRKVYKIDDKELVIDLSHDNTIDNFSIYIGKGKSCKDAIQYLSTLHIPNKLACMTTLLDAYAQTTGNKPDEFDKTIRKLSVTTEVLYRLIEVLFDKIIPKLNNDLRVYTLKKYKKLYADKAYAMTILKEVIEILQDYIVFESISKEDVKERLLPFYRSIYGLKELTENMYLTLNKFKIPKLETDMKSISLTMIDDYPFFGENLLFGRYATNIRNRHFYEEYESAIKNHKNAISGVTARMNHNAKLLNTTAEKYFKKTFKTPVKDVFSTIYLWGIESIHISETIAGLLKSLEIKKTPIVSEDKRDKGYATVEAYDGTLICEVTVKNNKIINVSYYNGAMQNIKLTHTLTEQLIENNKQSPDFLRNIYLLMYTLVPSANIMIKEKKIEDKKNELKPPVEEKTT